MLATTEIDAALIAPRAARIDASRVIDVALAAAGLAFLAPLMLLIAAAVYLADGGPALFAHRRIGRDGRTFRCWKFRTMVVDAETRLAELLAVDPAVAGEWARGRKLRRDPRVTAIGLFLRRTSLDELPQLFNVLAGEMAIVGPRPIVGGEIDYYGRRFADYASVKPGLTGLWQVSRRCHTSYRRRVALDVAYARRRTLLLDAWIIAMTIPALLLQRGSY